MNDGEFPARDFNMRSEGYDRDQVDSYVGDLQSEIVEMRRALEAATSSGGAASDARLHDPEGAVTRTLAIAQETADRVLHDAQVEADNRKAEADEHATTVIADADERAARLLADMEAQAAEVREQGVAAARSAIQVERDKAMAELAHVRRVRDDLRTEAVELKSALDRYRSQAREASDTLAAASSGPLMSLDLPDFIDDDVVLAGIAAPGAADEEVAIDFDADDSFEAGSDFDDGFDGADIGAADIDGADIDEADFDASEDADDGLADVIAIDHQSDADLEDLEGMDDVEEIDHADADEVVTDAVDEQADAADDGFGGTFLAEVRAAAKEDDVALPPEDEGSDRFLSELRGIADVEGDELDSDAADTFFDAD